MKFLQKTALYAGLAILAVTGCKKDEDPSPSETLPTVVLTNNSFSMGDSLFTPDGSSNIYWADSGNKYSITALKTGKARIAVKFNEGMGTPPAGTYKVVVNNKMLKNDEVSVVLDILKSNGTIDSSFSSSGTDKTVLVTVTGDTTSIVLTNATLSSKSVKKTFVSAKLKLKTKVINYASFMIGTDAFTTSGSGVSTSTSGNEFVVEANDYAAYKYVEVHFGDQNIVAKTYPIVVYDFANEIPAGKAGIYAVGNYIGSYSSLAGGTAVVTKANGKTTVKVTGVTGTAYPAVQKPITADITYFD